MAKATSAKTFLRTIEGICLIESIYRQLLKTYKDAKPSDGDRWATFQILSDGYLKISDACDRKLRTDLAARKEYEELQKMIEAGLTPAELEQTLEAHFVRKGWGSYEFVRSTMFTYLTENGLKAEQAHEMIDACVPKGDERSRQLPVAHKIRKVYQRMNKSLTDGAQSLSEALSPVEGVHDGTDGVTKGPTVQEATEGTPEQVRSSDRETKEPKQQ